MSDYDLCVIGGGINGAGIARDAAGRGLRVLLVEAGDIAGATSSRSTKLIHGGLRYLEFYEFKLVRESLKEREVLLNIAPHIIWPLTFILPHEAHLRPAWMIRIGLFLYDHLGGRKKLSRSHHVDLLNELPGEALKDEYSDGFSYADCWVQDSRLVVLNAIDVRERGGRVMVGTRCTGLRAQNDEWQIDLLDRHSGDAKTISAKMVVNAAGPWVHEFLAKNNLLSPQIPGIRLVKGSHIVVPKLFEGKHAYILQQPDRRIVFAIPYEDKFTLVGTTEKDFEGNAANISIDPDEVDYLCEAINRSFKRPITKSDVVWSYSGVRPLLKDENESATATTRDYRLILDESHGPLILSVFGGKITTFRHLAEEAVDALQESAGFEGKPWTGGTPLPGGSIENADFDAFFARTVAQHPWMPQDTLYRYARNYGARLRWIVGSKTDVAQLGDHYGDGLYEAEIRYLIEEEFARSTDDILWRRTKMGLHISPDTKGRLEKAVPTLLKEILGL